MAKILVALWLMGCAWSQSNQASLFVIPDFKVTAESLADAHRNHPVLIDAADSEYESARKQVFVMRGVFSPAYLYRLRACKTMFVTKPAFCSEMVTSAGVVHIKTY